MYWHNKKNHPQELDVEMWGPIAVKNHVNVFFLSRNNLQVTNYPTKFRNPTSFIHIYVEHFPA